MASSANSSNSTISKVQKICTIILVFLTIQTKIKPIKSLDEHERLEEYRKRGYTFPPKEYKPNTTGWKEIMERRMKQISNTVRDDNTKKYNAWLVTMGSSVVIQNYTNYGWGLTRAPDDVIKELRDSLYNNAPFARNEHKIDVMDGSPKSRFIDQADLNNWVAQRIKKMHEEWSGIELVPSIAYGLRLYQNASALLMHTDKPNTHVISCILHVGRSPDAEPWPIAIEDYTGTTNEVFLEPGDMLFYESAKCLHGRTTTFIGSWYTSLFVHYRPKYNWDMDAPHMEKHYAVPPNWIDTDRFPLDDGEEEMEELVIVGTGFKEPSCEGNWCALKNSKKWHGPAIKGVVIDPGYDMDRDKEQPYIRSAFQNKEEQEEDEEDEF